MSTINSSFISIPSEKLLTLCQIARKNLHKKRSKLKEEVVQEEIQNSISVIDKGLTFFQWLFQTKTPKIEPQVITREQAIKNLDSYDFHDGFGMYLKWSGACIYYDDDDTIIWRLENACRAGVNVAVTAEDFSTITYFAGDEAVEQTFQRGYR